MDIVDLVYLGKDLLKANSTLKYAPNEEKDNIYSSGEKILIVYESQYGSTDEVAKEIGKMLVGKRKMVELKADSRYNRHNRILKK